MTLRWSGKMPTTLPISAQAKGKGLCSPCENESFESSHRSVPEQKDLAYHISSLGCIVKDLFQNDAGRPFRTQECVQGAGRQTSHRLREKFLLARAFVSAVKCAHQYHVDANKIRGKTATLVAEWQYGKATYFQRRAGWVGDLGQSWAQARAVVLGQGGRGWDAKTLAHIFPCSVIFTGRCYPRRLLSRSATWAAACSSMQLQLFSPRLDSNDSSQLPRAFSGIGFPRPTPQPEPATMNHVCLASISSRTSYASGADQMLRFQLFLLFFRVVT